MNEQQKSYLVVMARWQNFLGILAAIGAGFIILAGLMFLVMGIAFGSEMSDDLPFGQLGGVGVSIVGGSYMLLSVIYIVLAVYQIRAAKNLRIWAATDREENLTEGLKNTKSFFKFNGIMAIVGIALYVILIIVMIVILGTAALSL